MLQAADVEVLKHEWVTACGDVDVGIVTAAIGRFLRRGGDSRAGLVWYYIRGVLPLSRTVAEYYAEATHWLRDVGFTGTRFV
jgi:hypothetical protein